MKDSESDKCGQTDSQSDAANVHFLSVCEGRGEVFSRWTYVYCWPDSEWKGEKVMRQERGGDRQSSRVLTWVLADGM